MKFMEIQKDKDLPEDAKKYMFAEDFISYFMILNGYSADFQKVITEQYRCLIPRAFNEVIQISAYFLYSRICVFHTFLSFDANKMINISTFVLFVEHLQSRYFSNDSINPQKLLYFCSHLAYMTNSFYAKGEKEIPKLAANYIVKTMKMYKTSEADFWNGLNIAAFKYFKVALECGFIKMSALESVKIQFVVHESVKEEIFNNRIIKDSSIAGKHESELLKAAAKRKKNRWLFDDRILSQTISVIAGVNRNNQNKTEIEKLSGISSKRERLVLKIINGFINRTEIISPKTEDRVDCPKMEKKENEFKMTHATTREEIVSPKEKERVNCRKMQQDVNALSIKHPVTRTEVTASPKKEELLNCPKIHQKDNEFKVTSSEIRTEIMTSPRKNEQVNCPKMQLKFNELKTVQPSTRTEVLSPPKQKELVNCHKMQQKDNETEMTPHHAVRKEMMDSPEKENRDHCSLMKEKDSELKMTKPVIDRSSVNESIENSSQNDKQVNNFIHSNKNTFLKNNVNDKAFDETGKDSSNKKCCVENKLDRVEYSIKRKVPSSNNSYGCKSSVEINMARNEVKYVVENDKTFLTVSDNSECSFNRSIEIAADDSEVKVEEDEIEQLFNESENDMLCNIQKENILNCINSIMKDEIFAMNDSYSICNTEAAENSTSTTNMPNLPNLDAVDGNCKEESELTYNRFINKNESVRKVDDHSLLEMTPKNPKNNYIDNKEQFLDDSCNSVASNRTSCATKSSDEYMQKNTVNTEASTCIDGLKNESNVISMKSDEQEIDETLLSLSQKDDLIIVNDTKPKTPLASTTVTYSQRMSPSIFEKIDDRLMSSSELNTKLPSSVVTEEILSSTMNSEFANDEEHVAGKLEKRKKSDTENSPMVTVDFDICDKFVIDMVTSADELELYGQTNEDFLSKEDDFNSTFDILSVEHYMATYYGTEFLDITSI